MSFSFKYVCPHMKFKCVVGIMVIIYVIDSLLDRSISHFSSKKNKNKNCLFDDVNKPLRFTVSERVEKNIE